jgi:hypothetical protein
MTKVVLMTMLANALPLMSLLPLNISTVGPNIPASACPTVGMWSGSSPTHLCLYCVSSLLLASFNKVRVFT